MTGPGNDLAFVAACRRRRHHGLDLGQELRPSSPGLKVMEPSSLPDEVSTLTKVFVNFVPRRFVENVRTYVCTASRVPQMALSLFWSFLT